MYSPVSKSSIRDKSKGKRSMENDILSGTPLPNDVGVSVKRGQGGASSKNSPETVEEQVGGSLKRSSIRLSTDPCGVYSSSYRDPYRESLFFPSEYFPSPPQLLLLGKGTILDSSKS